MIYSPEQIYKALISLLHSQNYQPTNMSPDGAGTKTVTNNVQSKAKSFDHPLDPLSPKEVCYLTHLGVPSSLSVVIIKDCYHSPINPSSYCRPHRTQSRQVHHMYSTSPTQESRPCVPGHSTQSWRKARYSSPHREKGWSWREYSKHRPA